MSTIYGQPIDYFSIKRLRRMSASLHISHNLSVAKATLIAAIKAA